MPGQDSCPTKAHFSVGWDFCHFCVVWGSLHLWPVCWSTWLRASVVLFHLTYKVCFNVSFLLKSFIPRRCFSQENICDLWLGQIIKIYKTTPGGGPNRPLLDNFAHKLNWLCPCLYLICRFISMSGFYKRACLKVRTIILILNLS